MHASHTHIHTYAPTHLLIHIYTHTHTHTYCDIFSHTFFLFHLSGCVGGGGEGRTSFWCILISYNCEIKVLITYLIACHAQPQVPVSDGEEEDFVSSSPSSSSSSSTSSSSPPSSSSPGPPPPSPRCWQRNFDLQPSPPSLTYTNKY